MEKARVPYSKQQEENEMEQKAKEHLAETHAKTMFCITYVAVVLFFSLAASLLPRLIMGTLWANKYNNCVMAVSFGIVLGLAEFMARRVAKRTKK
jgi:hypothetical protein